MVAYNKKSKYNFWHSPIALGLLFCLVALFAYNMIGLIGRERETNKNKVSELNKLDQLRSQQTALTKDINNLDTDEGVEASVREKFQVVKPGEKMVTVVDENETQDQAKNSIPANHSFWAYIKSLFIK